MLSGDNDNNLLRCGLNKLKNFDFKLTVIAPFASRRIKSRGKYYKLVCSRVPTSNGNP